MWSTNISQIVVWAALVLVASFYILKLSGVGSDLSS